MVGMFDGKESSYDITNRMESYLVFSIYFGVFNRFIGVYLYRGVSISLLLCVDCADDLSKATYIG
jgi:hypothetical protein